MKSKEVLITLHNNQDYGEYNDNIEVTMLGQMTQERSKTTLKYQEMDSTGMPGMTTTVDILTDVVSIRRDGSSPLIAQTLMSIEKGKRRLNQYCTEHGNMMLGIFGDEIKSNFDENGGELLLKYTIDINSYLTSKNTMEIKVKYLENK